MFKIKKILIQSITVDINIKKMKGRKENKIKMIHYKEFNFFTLKKRLVE